MAATPLQTFGVDADAIRSHLAQLPTTGAGDVLTAARITALVEECASEVCGVLLAAGIAPASVAAEPLSVAYTSCRRLILALVAPLVLRSLHGTGFGVSQDLVDAATRARELMARIEHNPTLLGWDSGGSSPSAWASTTDYVDGSAVVTRIWAETPTRTPEW